MRSLRDIRQRVGMTQAGLAERAGIGLNSLARYERGEVTPSVEMAHKVAEALGVSLSGLLDGPMLDTWAFKVVYQREDREEVIDVTRNTSNAELVVGERGMALRLDGPYELWSDDARFEELIQDLRRKRETGLKSRKEG